MRRMLVPALLAAIVAALLPAAPSRAGAGPEPAAPPLVWGACEDIPDPRLQCAPLRVPLDYRRPQGRTIVVMVSRLAATDPSLRRGILLLNPGGPGGSGVGLPLFLAETLPASVLARYDLIGFDPRGVGQSTPISCGIPDDTGPDLILPYPAPDGSIERNIAFARRTAQSCAATAGDILPYITTANTARDMDRIRAALGERKLSYLGYSYGTYLGAVFTALFPNRGDRIILDSAVDPNLVWYDVWGTWGPAIALRMPDFTKWAAARNDVYGLGATPAEVQRTYFRIAERLDREPVVLPQITVNGNVFREETRSDLYDDRLFGTLAEIWQFLLNPVGPPPVAVATPDRVRVAQPPADNGVAVLYAIVCNDANWPRDPQTYARNVALDRRIFPITAGMPKNIWPCAFWPHRPIEPPVKVTDNGPRNVLILQNLRDPATSWRNGFGLRLALDERAAFVTVDAGGHGIYGIRSGPCVDAIATSFLTEGTLPAHDRFCRGPSPEDVSTALTTPYRIPSGPLGVPLVAG